MKRGAGALLAVVALTVLASCKVDVGLEIRAREDGSGLVQARFTLDAEALESLGGDLDDRLRVADLIHAGWVVETRATESGGAVVAARKEFETPAQLTEVVDELSGDTGPFREFELVRERSRFRTSFEFSGRVDLQAGVGRSVLDPDDEGLRAPLGDEGVDIEDLQGFLAERIDEAFTFEVVANLPGDGSDNAPHGVGGEPAWRPTLGEEVELRASSSLLDRTRVGLLGTAGLLGVLAVALLTGVKLHRGPRRRPPAT